MVNIRGKHLIWNPNKWTLRNNKDYHGKNRNSEVKEIPFDTWSNGISLAKEEGGWAVWTWDGRVVLWNAGWIKATVPGKGEREVAVLACGGTGIRGTGVREEAAWDGPELDLWVEGFINLVMRWIGWVMGGNWVGYLIWDDPVGTSEAWASPPPLATGITWPVSCRK